MLFFVSSLCVQAQNRNVIRPTKVTTNSDKPDKKDSPNPRKNEVPSKSTRPSKGRVSHEQPLSDYVEETPREKYVRACALFRGEDYIEAFPLFKQLGDRKYPDAYDFVGWSYQYGKGVAKDEEKALEWYEKARIYSENNWGIYHYANLLYSRGDYPKALTCFLQGATSSNWKGECALKAAEMYEKGLGTAKDRALAAKYYEIAAKEGNSKVASQAKDALARLGAQ